MSNFSDENKGQIWGNDKKDTDRHPDFKGSVNVEGKEYWVAAWKRDPNGNPKAPALRFALTAKDEGSHSTKNEQQPQSGAGSTQGGGGFSDEDFESDSIPF